MRRALLAWNVSVWLPEARRPRSSRVFPLNTLTRFRSSPCRKTTGGTRFARRLRPRQCGAVSSPSAGFTLIEAGITLALVGTLASLAIPLYVGFLQRAAEAAVIQYLRDLHTAQLMLRMETDARDFTANFAQLEQHMALGRGKGRHRGSGRASPGGPDWDGESQAYQGYRVHLRAARDAADRATYRVVAAPADGRREVRWFYLDESGTLRADTGRAGPASPPL